MSSKRRSERLLLHSRRTTPEDVVALRRRRSSANSLPRLDELARAVRGLGLPPRRRTAEGREPFRL